MNETQSINETVELLIRRADRKLLLWLKNETRSDEMYEMVLAELVRRG